VSITFVKIVLIFLPNLIANVKRVAYIDQSIGYKWEKWSDNYTKVHYTEATQAGILKRPKKKRKHVLLSSYSKSHTILILLLLEVELRIPLEVTQYGADADLREGDLSMYACLSLPFQYKMIRFVQECDQLSPVQHYQNYWFCGFAVTKTDFE
jgi:hypothetical protein